jgi:hypothetical protein
MIRNRTRAIAVTTAAMAASLALAGTSMAASSAATRPVSATKTRTEYIQEVSASATSPVSQVIAHGAFTAAGTDTQTSQNTDLLKFPGGTFVATSKATSVQNHVDSGTCATTVTIRLTYTLGKGTGEFAGITGSGYATTTVLNLAVRTAHGGCSPTASIAQQSLVEASGPVTLR